jgi:hypothetical protein
MSTLTRRLKDPTYRTLADLRRRYPHRSIGKRLGVPTHVDQRQWTVPVYAASHRGIGNQGVLQRREAFERLWRENAPKITEADRVERRRERAHTEWKYKM